jgi:glutathione S-transferase
VRSSVLDGDAHRAVRRGRHRDLYQQWLCFIGTELHKATFAPLLDPHAPDTTKAYALEKAPARLTLLDSHLRGRAFLLDQFSVADAYLVTVMNWSIATPVKLDPYPALHAYVRRLRERPSVAKAFAEERQLFMREQATSRHPSL